MNRLRQIRERKSLALAQLSARTSIPLRILENYEANLEEISPAHLKVLSKALWVKPEELVPIGDAAPAPAVTSAVPYPFTPAPPAGAGPLPAAGGYDGASTAASGPAPLGHAGTYGTARPYVPSGPYGGARPEAPRPPRPAGAPPGGVARGAGRGRREPVIMPATDGQITEIMRLAARLNLSTEEIETEFGRSIENITRFDAREWIKKLREDAIAKAPPAKVHFGQWPGLKDDREAVYLAEQRELGSEFRIALFNGQVFHGRIIEFTPYTITLVQQTPGGAEQVVLRKLAVAYYQRTQPGAGQAPNAAPAGEAKDLAPFPGSGAPEFSTPGGAANSGALSGSEGTPSAGAGGTENAS